MGTKKKQGNGKSRKRVSREKQYLVSGACGIHCHYLSLKSPVTLFDSSFSESESTSCETTDDCGRNFIPVSRFSILATSVLGVLQVLRNTPALVMCKSGRSILAQAEALKGIAYAHLRGQCKGIINIAFPMGERRTKMSLVALSKRPYDLRTVQCSLQACNCHQF